MKRRAFIHEDFLLESDVARELYHVVAAKLPIIDYHCHLPPEQIAGNHQFATITEPDVRSRLVQTGQASYRFYDFPLPQHRNSMAASLAAALNSFLSTSLVSHLAPATPTRTAPTNAAKVR